MGCRNLCGCLAGASSAPRRWDGESSSRPDFCILFPHQLALGGVNGTCLGLLQSPLPCRPLGWDGEDRLPCCLPGAPAFLLCLGGRGHSTGPLWAAGRGLRGPQERGQAAALCPCGLSSPGRDQRCFLAFVPRAAAGLWVWSGQCLDCLAVGMERPLGWRLSCGDPRDSSPAHTLPDRGRDRPSTPVLCCAVLAHSGVSGRVWGGYPRGRGLLHCQSKSTDSKPAVPIQLKEPMSQSIQTAETP